MGQQWLDKSAAEALLREITTVGHTAIIAQALFSTRNQGPDLQNMLR